MESFVQGHSGEKVLIKVSRLVGELDDFKGASSKDIVFRKLRQNFCYGRFEKTRGAVGVKAREIKLGHGN